MSEPLQVTARVDAGGRVGLGHLRRTRTLLEELARRGAAVAVVGRIEPRAADALAGIPFVALPGADAAPESVDVRQTLAAIGGGDGRGSWVVVDHYDLGAEWERAVGAAGHRVLAIDDLRDRRHCAEILVSDSPERFEAALDDFAGGAVQLAGAKYALLEPEFGPVEKTLPASTAAPRLLVTYGGADPTGETAKALEAIRALREGGSAAEVGAIDVVVGPANPRSAELAALATGMDGVELHFAPSSLLDLIRAADLVATSGGNTTVESLAVGRPCLVTETAPNQAAMLRFLEAEKAILRLGRSGEVDSVVWLRGIDALLAVRLRLTSRLSERPVFDTRGPSRIVRAMSGERSTAPVGRASGGR